MDFVAIIPARYASTRFPAKPLALLGDKIVVEHVYLQAKRVFKDVFVATDDNRIMQAVMNFGGKVVMTKTNHKSGTDRCREAYEKCGIEAQVIVNIQGDEPFIHPSQLEGIIRCFDDLNTDIATLARPFNSNTNYKSLSNPNIPKVVVDSNLNALYFSRSVIPFLRDIPQDQWASNYTYLGHIGLYAYKRDVLNRITSISQDDLEIAENLEQLRWLSAGYRIKVGLTDIETIGIDTPDDLIKAQNYLNSKGL